MIPDTKYYQAYILIRELMNQINQIFKDSPDMKREDYVLFIPQKYLSKGKAWFAGIEVQGNKHVGDNIILAKKPTKEWPLIDMNRSSNFIHIWGIDNEESLHNDFMPILS